MKSILKVFSHITGAWRLIHHDDLLRRLEFWSRLLYYGGLRRGLWSLLRSHYNIFLLTALGWLLALNCWSCRAKKIIK